MQCEQFEDMFRAIDVASRHRVPDYDGPTGTSV
jgi:hypothetical protein